MSEKGKYIIELLKSVGSPSPERRKGVIIFILSLYAITLIGLIKLWYQTDTSIPFHWFDDAAEWLGMDKLGHAWVTFIETHLAFRLFRWAGYNNKKTLWLCGLAAFISQSTYEIFDGFSAGYGASVYDLMANAGGALFLIFQLSLFPKLIISFKFSFFKTTWAIFRPNLLGNNTFQQIVKDYNGQTYWLSFDVNQLTGKRIFPSWLTICIGYGAEGLLGGHDNIWETETGQQHDFSHIARTTQVVISLDILPQNISQEKPALRGLLSIFEYVKVPAPAVVISPAGISWKWLYF